MALAHFTLAVRDAAQAERFFATALKYKPIDRPANVSRKGAWLEIAPGQEIHLVEVPHFKSSPFEGEFGRHIAISFPKSAFPELKGRLRQLGAEIIEPTRETPFERFFFRDPNGYIFEVVEAEGRR